jgi:hypothetical protein
MGRCIGRVRGARVRTRLGIMKRAYWFFRQNFAFVLASLLSAGASGQSAPIGALRNSIVVRAGQVLDVRSGTYVKDAAIYVEGERIKAVGSASDVLKHAPTAASIMSDASRG